MASAEEVSGLNAPSLDAEPARAAEAVTLIDGQPVVGARRTLWLALQSRAFQVFSMICTFYALFAPDVCYGFLPAKADTAILSVGLSIVFFFFIAEGVATLVARPRSACELFFYLDVIATLSLVADILWIQEAFAGDASEELTLTRSARLARVGARAARLARMARVLRVLKVIKITLLAKTTGSAPEDLDEEEEDLTSVPAAIQEQVSDNVTRRVVMIVLISVIGSAALQFYDENYAASSAFAVMTEASATSQELQTQALVKRMDEHNIYYLRITKFTEPLIDRRSEQYYEDLRDSETLTYTTDESDACQGCEAWVDTSTDKVQRAVLNICLILLIIIILLVGSLRLSRDTVQVVLEPTQKLMRITRTSEALMSVFRAVATANGKSGIDTTITTVLDASRKMLSAEVVSIYFVDNVGGDLKLHQSTCDGGVDYTDDKELLYADELRIANTQTDTVIGSVVEDAKQHSDSDTSRPFYANLIWVPKLDGVINMDSHAKSGSSKSTTLRRTITTVTGRSSRSSGAPSVLNDVKETQLDSDWTERWKADPSITTITMQKQVQRGTVRNVYRPEQDQVRNQLCMAIVAEVGGRRRVVGMVQAMNKRIPKRRQKYEGALKLDDVGFKQDDVNSLEVFCMQIADLVEMKGKEAAYDDALKRDDGIGSMMRALESETVTPRVAPTRSRNSSFRKTAEAVKIANQMANGSGGGVKSVGESKVPIDQLQRWGYGCLDHTYNELALCTLQMFQDLRLLEEFAIEDSRLFQFTNKMLNSYNEVPYHNAYHGFSVMQGCYAFCSTMAQGKLLTKAEQFTLMISALGHDSGHDGVNTAFHVACESEIATLYNDLSPLENMHARRTLDLLKTEGMMGSLQAQDSKAIKALLVSLILGTDMKYHKEHELKLAKVHTFELQEVDGGSRADAQSLMECVLHGIDIGHPSYPWEEECRWARLVGTEFQAQVNREEAVTPDSVSGFMRCSGDQNLAKGQVGFFQFFVLPYYKELAKHVPELEGPTEQITVSTGRFERVRDGEEQMVAVTARDNEMMAWSKNVAMVALGTDHEEIKKGQPVTVLMTGIDEAAPPAKAPALESDDGGASRP